MAIIVCPVCSSEMSDKTDRCPVCNFPVVNLEQVKRKRDEDNTEFITICKQCCHFAIVKKKDLGNPCAMEGGEMTPVMTREKWFAMSESDREKAANRAVSAIKGSYKYNALLHRQYGSRVRIDKNMLVYCPRCGQYTSAHFAAERNNTCTFCGSEYRFTDRLYHDVHDEVESKLQSEAEAARDPNAEDDEEQTIPKADYVKAMDDYVMEHYLKDERFFNQNEMDRRIQRQR